MSNSNVYLVTGANGFIASALVKRLVEEGSTVKATVRRSESGEQLKQSISPSAKGKLEIFIIPDITSRGAFKTALEGVTHVFHTASPIPGPGKTDAKKDYLDPARAGTLSVLQDASETESVQKVVYTSSVAAILDIATLHTGNTFTENDWNPITYEAALGLSDKLANPKSEADFGQAAMGVYSASKRVAEQVAWDFQRDQNPNWALSTVHPVLVLGKPTMGTALDGSNGMFWGKISKRPLGPEDGTSFYVDLADVVEGHIQAMHRKEADGKRFILSAGNPQQYDLVKWVRERQPGLPIEDVEKPEDAEEVQKRLTTFDTSASRKVLGLEYKSAKQTVEELVDWIAESGVLKGQ